MKIVVIGCGSIGKRHMRNILALKVGEVFACDVDEQKRTYVQRELGITVYQNLGEALDHSRFDAAFICSPPSFHVGQASQLLSAEAHCFIEKPLSNGLEGIDELISLAGKKGKVVMVGYMLRFSPFLKRIKDLIDQGAIGKVLSVRASVGYYLPYWRPQEDYRKGYGARRELGGGILLDASHEIDYVRYLMGEISEVFAVCRKLSNLEIDTEDFAEIILGTENGAYAQIHLDYLQSNYRRSCEIIGEEGMLIWERTLKHYDREDKSYHCSYEGLNANVNDLYLEEIRHFFSCLAGKAQSLIGLEEAKGLQLIFESIRKSSESGRLLSL